MFRIDAETKKIHITRGDKGLIKLSVAKVDGTKYGFQAGESVILTVKAKKDCGGAYVVYKEVTVEEDNATEVSILLDSTDTKIGQQLSKPVTYWYEVSLNGTSTIIGYDENGAKEFILYPENGEDTEVLGEYTVEQKLEGEVLITETKVLVNNNGSLVVKNLSVSEETDDGEVIIEDPTTEDEDEEEETSESTDETNGSTEEPNNDVESEETTNE